MRANHAPLPLSVQGIWQRWCDGQSTADMEITTGRPEHECEAALYRCLEAAHAGNLRHLIFGGQNARHEV